MNGILFKIFPSAAKKLVIFLFFFESTLRVNLFFLNYFDNKNKYLNYLPK